MHQRQVLLKLLSGLTLGFSNLRSLQSSNGRLGEGPGDTSCCTPIATSALALSLGSALRGSDGWGTDGRWPNAVPTTPVCFSPHWAEALPQPHPKAILPTWETPPVHFPRPPTPDVLSQQWQSCLVGLMQSCLQATSGGSISIWFQSV